MTHNNLTGTAHFTVIGIFSALLIFSGITYGTQSFGLLDATLTLTILVTSGIELLLYGMGRYTLPKRQIILRRMVRKKQQDEYSVLGRDLGDNEGEIVANYTKKFWLEHLIAGIAGAIGVIFKILTTAWVTQTLGLILLFIVILFLYRNITEDPEKTMAPDTRVSATGQNPYYN